MKSLPALSPKMMAYTSMFQESGIVETPEILAEEVEASTFQMTFYNCKSLTKCTSSLKPKLLYSSSYNQMFKGCTSLIKAPEIQATHHNASGNYHMGQMFSGCTSLTSSPSLKIQTLGKQGYYQLFYGCKNLNKIEMLATDVSATGCLSSWVNGVASVGIFIKSSTATWDITGVNGIPSGWTVLDDSDYLTLSALGDGEITITIPAAVNQDYATSLGYSKDKSSWVETIVDDIDQTITIPVSAGDDVYLKGKAKQWSYFDRGIVYSTHIGLSTNIIASGNIMSLIYGDEFKDKTTFPGGSELTFAELFKGDTYLKNVGNLILPATTLADGCYQNMFYNCTSLTTAPELPATTLASECYQYMFHNCSSLTTGPTVLPATTLANRCYADMFSDCTSLVTAPELPATKLGKACYYDMFYGCTTLTTAPALPATTLADDCYEQMFSGCSSLTQAPELPATTLASNCYNRMFQNCTSLNKAPELIATKLVNFCYWGMFINCKKLNYVKAMFTTIPSNGLYINNWLNNVSSTGTFVKSKDATWSNERAYIPTGWTVQTA